MKTKTIFAPNGRPPYAGRSNIDPNRPEAEDYVSCKLRSLANVPIAIIMLAGSKQFDGLSGLLQNHHGHVLLSLGGSYAIASTATSVAHWGNRWLDTCIPWISDFSRRLVWQAVVPLLGGWTVGVLIAWGLHIVLADAYPRLGFIEFEIWVVFVLLITMNAYYGLWHMYRHPRPVLPETTVVRVQDQQGRQASVADQYIGYIAGYHRGVIVHLLDGRKCESRERLTHLANKFDGDRFLVLKRRYLINIKIIKGVQTVKEPKIHGDGAHGKIAGVVYRHELVFGNDRIKERREPLVKGSLKRVQRWVERNAHHG